jgi:hypothetical protein
MVLVGNQIMRTGFKKTAKKYTGPCEPGVFASLTIKLLRMFY